MQPLFTHPPLTRRWSGLDEINILTGKQTVSYLINTAINLCKGLGWLVSSRKIKIYLWCLIYADTMELFNQLMIFIILQYLPSPQAWPSSPVCFSKAASTNLDTVSNRDSLLRDALSQSTTEHRVLSVHCQVHFKANYSRNGNNGIHHLSSSKTDLCWWHSPACWSKGCWQVL